MKKLLPILILTSVISLSAVAQESVFKPFKVDVSVGYASPSGPGAKGGILFAVEPKYAVLPALSVGLRMEAAVVARFSGYDESGNAMDASVKAAGSYIATGDYYFRANKTFRPFSGGGIGIYSVAGIEATSNSGEVSAGSKFGGLVRSGFEFSHFRFGVEYNIVPKTKFTGYDGDGNPTTGLTSDNSYLGVKIGVCIGGGKK